MRYPQKDMLSMQCSGQELNKRNLKFHKETIGQAQIEKCSILKRRELSVSSNAEEGRENATD